MHDEQCPQCGLLFPAQRAWAHRSVAPLLNPVADDLDTRVRCPNCQYVFDATAYRFFGFVTPRAMRVGVAIFVAVFLGTMLYQLLVP